jgi:hypothetical protein
MDLKKTCLLLVSIVGPVLAEDAAQPRLGGHLDSLPWQIDAGDTNGLNDVERRLLAIEYPVPGRLSIEGSRVPEMLDRLIVLCGKGAETNEGTRVRIVADASLRQPDPVDGPPDVPSSDDPFAFYDPWPLSPLSEHPAAVRFWQSTVRRSSVPLLHFMWACLASGGLDYVMSGNVITIVRAKTNDEGGGRSRRANTLDPDVPAAGAPRVISSSEAAEIAAQLANDQCDRMFQERPFSATQYPAILKNGRYEWGHLEPIRRYSALVTLQSAGSGGRAQVYCSTDAIIPAVLRPVSPRLLPWGPGREP